LALTRNYKETVMARNILKPTELELNAAPIIL